MSATALGLPRDTRTRADERWLALSLPLEFAFSQAGLDDSERRESLDALWEAFSCPQGNGLRNLATAVKRWQKVARNVLSREAPSRDDDCTILSSRLACKLAHRFDRLGLSRSEIDLIILAQGRRRIPPFFLSKSLVRALLPNPSFECLRQVTPVACIGRTAPHGDASVAKDALGGFVENIENSLDWSFDFSSIVTNVLSRLANRVPTASYWEAPGKSSRDYSRGEGGKRGEVMNEIFLQFMHLPMSDIVPEKPPGDLMDILGNTAVFRETWDGDAPIGQILYSQPGENRLVEVDDRFGKIGLYWALLELKKLDGLKVEEDNIFPFLGLEKVPTISRVSGVIKARVTAQPEEGWKVRIITLTSLCVSLIGSVSRHLLDPVLLGADPLIRIGLRSKVKLYDSLVFLNGGSHMGIASEEANNVRLLFGISADLTTATDTPDRRVVNSVLNGWMDFIPDSHPCRSLLELGLNLAMVTREFEMPRGFSIADHCSGIMMGEGLSGIFLNTASLIVRAVIVSFMDAFPEIANLTEDQIDGYVLEHEEKLQVFLDTFDGSGGMTSSQSGDDLFAFTVAPSSPYMRVLYRMFGFQPSNSTWFESTQYVTFCEEHAIRTVDSNGWTFVDTVKPRLFNVDDPDPEAICSRIRQITNTLMYRKDVRLTSIAIPLVNKMLDLVPEVRNTLDRYHIPAGLPGWLGGIDHPEGILPEFDMGDEYRRLLVFLYEAPLETILEEYLIATHSAELFERNAKLISLTSSFLLLEEVDSKDNLNSQSWISRDSIEYPPRNEGEKWSLYRTRCDSYLQSNHLQTIKSILDRLSAGESIKSSLQDPDSEPLNVPVRTRLKKRRKQLLSIVPDDFQTDLERVPTPWEVRKLIERRLGNRLVNDEFVEELGLLNCPSFQVCGIHR